MADEFKLIRWGYPVKTNSEECVKYIDAFFQQVLCYGADSEIILKAGEADGDCVLANTLIASFVASKAPKDALLHLNTAQCKLGVATVYEKMVFKAVSSWVEAQDPEATLDLHSQELLNAAFVNAGINSLLEFVHS